MNDIGYSDVSTNGDGSCFCCCHENGVTIYDTYPLQKRLDLTFGNDNNTMASQGSSIGHCSLLNRSNYIALVGGGSGTTVLPAFPLNQVVIWDDLIKKVVFNLKFMYPVKEVILSRLYLVVLIRNELQLFTFTNPPKRLYPSKLLKTGSHIDFKLIKSTGILAYESLNRVGQIYISRIESDGTNPHGSTNHELDQDLKKHFLPTNIIKAHKNPIQMIQISPNGKYVATCSTRGTIIRVFNILNGILINEFRRGLDVVTIYGMKFNQDSTQLSVLSNKQTLHIFQIDDQRMTSKSICLIRLYNPSIRRSHEIFHSNDRCQMIWNVDDKSIILVWYKYRIWIRYMIVYDNDLQKKEIIRESWRQL